MKFEIEESLLRQVIAMLVGSPTGHINFNEYGVLIERLHRLTPIQEARGAGTMPPGASGNNASQT